jgi:hypothetical protein
MMSDASAHEPGGECRSCPVCLVLQALQEARPEVRAHLAAAGRELALALQAVLTSAADGGRSDVSSEGECGRSSEDAADSESVRSSDETRDTRQRRLRRIDIQ